MSNLFQINGHTLKPFARSPLAVEHQLQDWLAKDPKILGLDILIIGREVSITNRGRIDLLGLDSSGDVVILELKRDQTPRGIVGQVLDYASWAVALNTRDVHDLANRYLPQPLPAAFLAYFGLPLPSTLNGDHALYIVASELDDTTKRIVEYLSERHGLAINTALFRIFDDDGRRYLTTDWQLDPQEVEERSADKVRAPWSGLWYSNVGDGPHRSWEDMRRYGFLAAGGGRLYSGKLDLLSPGDSLYAYQKGKGYVGLGKVTSGSAMVRDFITPAGPLSSVTLEQPQLLHDLDDPEIAEYAVGVNWLVALPLSEAKTFRGVFANQNIVCKLRDAGTIEFLQQNFGT